MRQSLAVAAILAASLVVVAAGGAWALAPAASAGAVLSALVVLIGLRRQRMRECALDLIIERGEGAPIPVVQREVRRLRAPRTRRVLAEGFQVTLIDASCPRRQSRLSARVPVDGAMVLRVAAELNDVAGLLGSQSAGVRGIALAERLLTDGGSALYGHDAGPLHEELNRIRYLLQP